MELAGIPVILADTAGLRSGTVDEIEAAGMERAQRELQGADIVVWVTASDCDRNDLAPIDSEAIWIENKCDLLADRQDGPQLFVSAKTGEGLTKFMSLLAERASNLCGETESPILIRTRHEQAVRECARCLEGALDSPPERIELAAEKLRSAAQVIGRLTGAIGVEDVLDSIFSEFCIGK
jgi:tRNA modification GTPase